MPISLSLALLNFGANLQCLQTEMRARTPRNEAVSQICQTFFEVLDYNEIEKKTKLTDVNVPIN